MAMAPRRYIVVRGITGVVRGIDCVVVVIIVIFALS